MPKRSSNVAGREFASGLRAVLAKSGYSQRRLAEVLDFDEAKLSELVNGKVGGADEVEIRELLAFCQVPTAERRRLVVLFLEAKERGYIQFPEDGLPDQVGTLISHEKEATEIVAWSMILVPGLLQIHDYALAATEVSTLVEAADAPKLAAARTARAEVLERRRSFTFYVHEQALWLSVGGIEVWREQLAHLLRMAVRPYISIRIVPRAIGAHPGYAGDFRVMRFPKYPSVVFLDTLNCGLFFDDNETIEMYEGVIKALDAVALNEEQSKAVINSILEGLQ